MNCIFANSDCTGKLSFRMPLAAVEKSAAMCEYHWTLRKNDVRVAASTGCTCWEGYERVPGTKPCESGSCRKKSASMDLMKDVVQTVGPLLAPAAIAWQVTKNPLAKEFKEIDAEEDAREKAEAQGTTAAVGDKLKKFKETIQDAAESAGEKLFDVKMMPPGFEAPEQEQGSNAVTDAAERFVQHPIIQRINELGDAGEAQMAAWFKKMKGSRNDSLVEALKEVLGNAFSMYVRTHGAHWNVEGSDFAQYHELFETIYEDVYGSIDPLAENIRKLEGKAPGSISDFDEIDGLDSATEPDTSTGDLAQDVANANRVVLESLDKAFKIANDSNEQGIANFLAERIDMHQKWAWQLSASMSDGAESTDE